MPIIDKKLRKKDRRDCHIEIFAELTRKQYKLVQSGAATIAVPHGVAMKNKAGSRALNFTCPNRFVAKELEQGLDSSAISWQESYIEDGKY